MNIVRVDYRFLRISANQLALVEIMPESPIPEPTTCLYPKPPYLSPLRQSLVKVWQGENEFQEWITDCQFSFELAVEEAKRHPVIDYRNKCGKDREICLWSFLDPLEEVKWDEYCPLFTDSYEFVLRNN